MTTLLPEETCNVRVRFDPTATGPTFGKVVIGSKGFASPVRLNVNGTGIDAALSSSESALAFGVPGPRARPDRRAEHDDHERGPRHRRRSARCP